METSPGASEFWRRSKVLERSENIIHVGKWRGEDFLAVDVEDEVQVEVLRSYRDWRRKTLGF
jgi:hypothetical protein